MTRVTSQVIVSPSALARRLLMHSLYIAHWRANREFTFEPFTRPGAAITWILSGRGTVWVSGRSWPLEPGPVAWFYGTDQARRFVPDGGQGIVAKTIWLGGPALEVWLRELDVRNRPEFRLKRGFLDKVYTRLSALAGGRKGDWELKMHLQIASLLGDLLRSRELLPARTATLPRGVAMVLEAIDADPGRKWRASELPAIANMSYSAFRSLFRSSVGETPREYLHRVRLNLAREMLANPQTSIKEVAGKLRFCDDEYFSNFFHKHEGIRPSEFRRLAAGQSATQTSRRRPGSRALRE